MQIDFLVRWLPPRIDGVGDYTWNLANALRKSGIDARIFTSEGQGYSGLSASGWVFPVISKWEPKEVVKALRPAKGEISSDWLSFQYVPQMYGRGCIAWGVASIMRALKKELRCNIAVTLHEFASGWGFLPKDLFLAALTRLQTRRLLSTIDSAITTCARYKGILKRLSGNSLPVSVIPAGSNIAPVFIVREELLNFRRRIFPDKVKVLGLFSRLSKFRNFPLALKVLKRARERGMDAWLYLIGSVEPSNPKLFKDLMRLAVKLGVKQYVVTSGELPCEDLSLHLQMLDVFIFPQTDGISTRNTALMAAMAHGLPVVSFEPLPGNFDNFSLPCAVLVNRNDEEAFVEAALGSLAKSDILSGQAQANRDYYYSNFSWQVIAKEYLKALTEIK